MTIVYVCTTYLRAFGGFNSESIKICFCDKWLVITSGIMIISCKASENHTDVHFLVFKTYKTQK